MSTTRGTISNAAKADAAHQALVAEQWRDWHAYLQAQLQLLDAQQAEDTSLPSFERQTTSWEVQREQAEATLKRIPAARRAVFDAERDLRGRKSSAIWSRRGARRARLDSLVCSTLTSSNVSCCTVCCARRKDATLQQSAVWCRWAMAAGMRCMCHRS